MTRLCARNHPARVCPSSLPTALLTYLLFTIASTTHADATSFGSRKGYHHILTGLLEVTSSTHFALRPRTYLGTCPPKDVFVHIHLSNPRALVYIRDTKESNVPKSKKSNASTPRRRFVGTKTKTPSSSSGPTQRYIPNQIPSEILEDPELNHAIQSVLPSNYSFEIHKTIHHIRKNDSKMVALQMPEGLQMFACVIADIIEQFTSALTTILGDVTYGACCVDDYTARALGCDMLIHYGHSCLVPLDQTTIKTLYVFVEIQIDSDHLEKTIRMNFPSDREVFRESVIEAPKITEEKEGKTIEAGEKLATAKPVLRIEGPGSGMSEGEVSENVDVEPTRLALVSTIQFVAALQKLKEDLSIDYPVEGESTLWGGKYAAMIPRSKPLSPGEILGCTAPKLGDDVDALIYLGDGRFHLESIMIANPRIPAFRYDPYSKKLTREQYNHVEMRTVRRDAVRKAQKSIMDLESGQDDKPLWGVVLGTLGRQGSFKQLQAITNQLSESRTEVPYMPILLSELSPAKLGLFNGSSLNIATFVQTSCPRLSIDWGYAFEQPLLSPYETAVAVGSGYQVGWMDDTDVYPMDFYSVGTPWAVSRLKGVY
ncbi:hypothetical protein D9758_001273 [Tetrapyrgos nigripes]|uniref:2-(3-amino-3-carboxypropyl)histidine synthase subunit 1 n=1 Tax=Tetrapyrgos nigripes TaxID=182062 RepID=A0A8H5GS31_9AGAR|nr:hypothetical protein D9758_001273 [Tetrapyrgos nigripes]